MCVVNKESKYEVIVCDLESNPIVSIGFNSISMICRVLDETDLSRCKVEVIRKSDCQILDTELMLSIWRNE